MPFKHVLIPTDLTDRTDAAINMSSKFMMPRSSRVTLLHVIETIDGVRASELRAFYQRLERKARAAMRAIARRGPDLDVDYAVVYGRRADEIVTFATERAVDLIVLASHRVNPSMAGRDWGTISYKVGLLAPCPVLLVK